MRTALGLALSVGCLRLRLMERSMSRRGVPLLPFSRNFTR